MHQRYGSREPTDSTAFNVVRSGTVVNRRMGQNGPEVQVAYEDRGVVSDWIPVGAQGAAGMTMFYLPRLNDNVTVLHYPSAIEQGIVVCTNPTSHGGSIQPDSLNSVALRGDNGEQFSYNPDTKTLAFQGVGTLNISASADTNHQSKGNHTNTVGGTFKVTAATINLNGVIIDSAGNVTIPGTLSVKGNVDFKAQGQIAAHLTNLDGSGGGS